MGEGPLRYWDDVEVGEVFVAGPKHVSAEEIVAFARKFDPQYFHVDAEAAKEGPFGVLTASGWHTSAMAMRLMVEGLLTQVASQGAPGVKLCRWLKPVTPGTTLTLHTEIRDKYPSKSRSSIGFCYARHELKDQTGAVVAQFENNFMIGRDPARAAA